jgi:hypothetical protein
MVRGEERTINFDRIAIGVSFLPQLMYELAIDADTTLLDHHLCLSSGSHAPTR